MKIKELLAEIKISPAVFKRFAKSSEAATVLIGVEYEIFFKDALKDSETVIWDNTVVDKLAKSFTSATGVSALRGKSHESLRQGDTHWLFVPDGSLTGRGPTDDLGLEIKSPPVPIAQFKRDFANLVRWARANQAYTNNLTGLHINMSVPGTTIDYLKLVLFSGSDKVSADFERSASQWAESNKQRIEQRLRSSNIGGLAARASTQQRVFDLLRDGLHNEAGKFIEQHNTGKYFQVNLHNNYVEFRSPGNDWLGQYLGLVNNTVMRFALALTIAVDPERYKNEYTSKMMKIFGQHEHTNKLIQEINSFPERIMKIKNPSEKLQLAAITSKNAPPDALDRYIINAGITPSETVQLAAVKSNIGVMQYILKANITPSEAVQLAAVKRDNSAFVDMVESGITPSEQVQYEAVKKDPSVISTIISELDEPPHERILSKAIELHGGLITTVIELGIEPSESMLVDAIYSNEAVIPYIFDHYKKQNKQQQLTDAVLIAAIDQRTGSLDYMFDANIIPSNRVLLFAINEDLDAVDIIFDNLKKLGKLDILNDKIQLAAIKKDSNAIKTLFDAGVVPNEKTIIKAIEHDVFYVFNHVVDYFKKINKLDSISDDILIAAVRHSSLGSASIAFSNRNLSIMLDAGIVPSEEVQIAAVHNNIYNIELLIRSNIQLSSTVLAKSQEALLATMRYMQRNNAEGGVPDELYDLRKRLRDMEDSVHKNKYSNLKRKDSDEN